MLFSAEDINLEADVHDEAGPGKLPVIDMSLDYLIKKLIEE